MDQAAASRAAAFDMDPPIGSQTFSHVASAASDLRSAAEQTPAEPRRLVSLPGAEHAFIDREKLTDYLLSTEHPTGAEKARVFAAMGYHLRTVEAFERRLLEAARTHRVAAVLSAAHGTKYALEGYLAGETGSGIWLRTIWIVEPDLPGPRLVTAYPA